MKIYLTRHGETKWNVEGRLQGSKDSPLTKKGIEDAKALGHRLSKVDLDVIYSSTSPRAMITAEIIRGKRNIKIIQMDALKEMDTGDWQGRTLKEIEKNHPQEYHNYWNSPHLYRAANGGEKFNQVQRRAIAVIKDIINEKRYQSILIISHGVTLKSIITYYQGKPIERIWDPPIIRGGSLSLMEAYGNDIAIPFLGDISHIED